MDGFRELIGEAQALRSAGQSFAVAFILEKEGSAPRSTGTMMLVRPDGTALGTIGGGLLEARAAETAVRVIAGGLPELFRFDLGEGGDGMICGGDTLVFVDYIDGKSAEYAALLDDIAGFIRRRQSFDITVLPEPSLPCRQEVAPGGEGTGGFYAVDRGYRRHAAAPPHAVIFGAGHVGSALSHILLTVGFDVTVADDREGFTGSGAFSKAIETVVLDSYGPGILDGVADNSELFCVSAARAHELDLEVMTQCLKTRAGYVGMIASRPKREGIFRMLRERGFTDSELERIYSPIGVRIGGETPEEIAVSIAAEMIRVRRLGK